MSSEATPLGPDPELLEQTRLQEGYRITRKVSEHAHHFSEEMRQSIASIARLIDQRSDSAIVEFRQYENFEALVRIELLDAAGNTVVSLAPQQSSTYSPAIRQLLSVMSDACRLYRSIGSDSAQALIRF